MKLCIVLGGAGFIGHHLAKRLKNKNNYVIVIDKDPSTKNTDLIYYNSYFQNNLLSNDCWRMLLARVDMLIPIYQITDIEVYQLACNMGGAEFIFTGENDYEIISHSANINLFCSFFCDTLQQVYPDVKTKLFYSSSACMYPAYNQKDPKNPKCSEDSAYPAEPDSEYGWEKLFSERLYLTQHRTKKLDVRIARFHNIYGPEGTYVGGREKAPAAMCRKVTEAILEQKDEIEIFGTGEQTRSFLYIEDCLDAVEALMASDFVGPVNIGSEEMVTIKELLETVMGIAKVKKKIKCVPGPVGVMGRNSDNRLIEAMLGWKPKYSLREGMGLTYKWIYEKISRA